MVSSEAWAKLREWAILAGKGRLLLSGSVVLASLKAAVFTARINASAKTFSRLSNEALVIQRGFGYLPRFQCFTSAFYRNIIIWIDISGCGA